MWTALQNDGPNHLGLWLIRVEAGPQQSMYDPTWKSVAVERGLPKAEPSSFLIFGDKGKSDFLVDSLREEGHTPILITRSSSYGRVNGGLGSINPTTEVQGTPQHELHPHTMALITSDCGAMRSPAHQMALITSGCAPSRAITRRSSRTRCGTTSRRAPASSTPGRRRSTIPSPRTPRSTPVNNRDYPQH